MSRICVSCQVNRLSNQYKNENSTVCQICRKQKEELAAMKFKFAVNLGVDGLNKDSEIEMINSKGRYVGKTEYHKAVESVKEGKAKVITPISIYFYPKLKQKQEAPKKINKYNGHRVDFAYPVYNLEGKIISAIENPTEKTTEELNDDRWIKVYCDASIGDRDGESYSAISSIVIKSKKIIFDKKFYNSSEKIFNSTVGELKAVELSMDTLKRMNFFTEEIFIYSDISGIDKHINKKFVDQKCEKVVSDIKEKLHLFSIKNPYTKVTIRYLDASGQKNQFYKFCHREANSMIKACVRL